MLKFINKQLSQKELHEVQKHLIDCDFCSEALEGLEYAKNSSVLFNIDHKITARTQQKSIPFGRIILVAASLILITVGGYFTISTFNNATQINQNELSYQEPTKNDNQDLMPAQESLIQKETAATQKTSYNVEQNSSNAESQTQEKLASDYNYSNKNQVVDAISTSGAKGEDVSQQNDKVTATGSVYKTEVAEADQSTVDFESAGILEETPLEKPAKADFYNAPQSKNQGPEKEVISEKSKKSSDTKQRAKKEAEAFAPSTISDEFDNKKSEEKTLTRDENTSISEVTGGISTGTTTNSRDLLVDGINDFNAKKYTKAIENFDVVLSKSPTTSSTYEAKWYKALCLIELNNKTTAKKLLNELVQVNNPFSKKAEEKLVELK